MDGLSAAASVIAVIQLAEDVFSLCRDYVLAVKDARRDIELLCGEVTSLHDVLETLDDWLQGTDPAKFAVLRKLQGSGNGPLEVCQRELSSIKETLETFQPQGTSGSKNGSRMRRVGFRALKWPLSSKEVRTRVDALSKQKQTLTLALATETKKETSNIQDGLAALTITVMDAVKDVSKDRVISWLERVKPASNHSAAVSKHQKSTGTWLLDTREFQEWEQDGGSLLWLYGIPGSGKTILVSTVIEALKKSDSPKSSGILYYYFDFTDPSKQSVDNFLRSLLAQLCHLHPATLEKAAQLYNNYLSGREQPAVQEIRTTFLEAISSLDGLYIVADALDECPRDQEREILLAVINDIAKCKNLHLMASSRDESDIASNFRNPGYGVLKIEVAGSGVTSDIENYISSQFSQDQKLKRFPTQLRDEAKKVLSGKANGMFRWVFCQLEELKRCRTKQKFTEALHTLPETLSETYERIIRGLDPDFQDHALRSLTWIAFALRPLTLGEIAEAAVIDPEATPPFHPEKRFLDPEMDILELLGSFITMENPAANLVAVKDEAHTKSADTSAKGIRSLGNPVATVKLAHFTVKEYLAGKWHTDLTKKDYSGTPPTAELFISTCCIYYILYVFDHTGPEQDYGDFQLFSYSTKLWPQHIGKLPHDLRQGLEPLVLRVLASPGPLDKWKKTYNHVLAQDSTQIHYAAYLGCSEFVEKLIHSGADAARRNSQGLTPLHMAAREGYEDVVEVMMKEIGSDIEKQAVIPSPMYYASRGGHLRAAETILKFLGPGWTWEGRAYPPLHIAVAARHLQMVELLLRHGVPVRSVDFYGTSALHHVAMPLKEAAADNSLEIAKVLTTNGADVNACDDLGVSPLHLCCTRPHTVNLALVEYLISQGASINKSTNKFDGCRSPLQLACMHGASVGLIRLLIDHGASIDLADRRGATAWLRACERPDKNAEIIKFLLDHGARIDHKDSTLQSALHKACISGSEEVLQLLIDKGLNVNDRDLQGNTVFHLAGIQGRIETLQFFLRHGADINEQAKNGATALHMACSTLSPKAILIQMLLDNGADSSLKDDAGRTPLDRLSEAGVTDDRILRLFQTVETKVSDEMST